jgi:hypothetical protein
MRLFSDLYRRGMYSLSRLMAADGDPGERATQRRWTRDGRRPLTTLYFALPIRNARFALGTVRATAGALDALRAGATEPFTLVSRHARGDWGDISEEQKARNDQGLKHALRFLSQYRLSTGTEVWILTEINHTLTLLLTEEEYWETM